jgi:antitoxin component of RelBE/YafQ-DinJ toxin-antitoxin module
MEYTAKINHNAYKPETRVISDKPSVKVGQWWQWNAKAKESHGFRKKYKFCITEIDGIFVICKYEDGFVKSSFVSSISNHATLILDPDWPIEIGDRFQAERKIWRGNGPWIAETVIWEVDNINGDSALLKNESGEYNEEWVVSIKDLRQMRRLPRVEKDDKEFRKEFSARFKAAVEEVLTWPEWKKQKPIITAEDYSNPSMIGKHHIADASEKVPEDNQQCQKTINELFDKHPKHFIDNHVANGEGGYYDPEPAMRWVNDHYEDYVAKGKRIAELEAERDAARNEYTNAKENLDLLFSQICEMCESLGANRKETPCDSWTLNELICKMIKERDAALARVKELEEEEKLHDWLTEKQGKRIEEFEKWAKDVKLSIIKLNRTILTDPATTPTTGSEETK